MFPYENLDVYKKAFKLNRKIYSFLKQNQSIASY